MQSAHHVQRQTLGSFPRRLSKALSFAFTETPFPYHLVFISLRDAEEVMWLWQHVHGTETGASRAGPQHLAWARLGTAGKFRKDARRQGWLRGGGGDESSEEPLFFVT